MQLRPVFAVNVRTMEVFRFENRKEAEHRLSISQTSIGNSIRGHHKIVRGFLFAEDESEITEERIREIKKDMQSSRGVIAINSITLEVSVFNSQVSAGRRLGIDPRRVNDILKGRQNESHGVWFCRADKNAIEKARIEFSDEVVDKVEELMNKRL